MSAKSPAPKSAPKKAAVSSRPPPGLLDGFMTRGELAKQLNKCERTLSRWEKFRQGPPITMLGDTILYRIESVHVWLSTREAKRIESVKQRRRRIAA